MCESDFNYLLRLILSDTCDLMSFKHCDLRDWELIGFIRVCSDDAIAGKWLDYDYAPCPSFD